MHMKKAIALIAVLGVIALGAFVVVSTSHAGSCCSGAKAQGASAGSGCPMHQTGAEKTGAKAEGAGCPMHQGSAQGCAMGKGGGACCGGMGCSTSGHQCSMPAGECEKAMRAYYQGHGWAGMEMQCASMETMQPTVTKVFPGSPAEAAGFKTGDILVAVNGVKFGPDQQEALSKVMTDGTKVGDTLTYQVDREAQKVETQLKVTLIQIPEPAMAQMIADHKANAHKSDKAEAVPAK